MLKSISKAKTETIVTEIIKVNEEYQELKKYLDSLKDELKARTDNNSESYETTNHKVTVVYKKESVFAGIKTFEYGCKTKLENKEQLIEVRYHVVSHKWTIKKIVC